MSKSGRSGGSHPKVPEKQYSNPSRSGTNHEKASLQDVLMQNDQQMEKSHKTKSHGTKSKKSPCSGHSKSDASPKNDLSGHGLGFKLNTSLDKSGHSLLGAGPQQTHHPLVIAD